MPEHELSKLIKDLVVAYIPIYSMFDHQTKLVDLGCDGNVNRWMTNFYKSGQTWKKLMVFGPCHDLAKSDEVFAAFKSKIDANFKNFEYVESAAFGGGAKKQRSSEFPTELIREYKDKLLSSDVIIVESQELFGAILTAKRSGAWSGKLVYWCPVCATSKKTRTFLEAGREADKTCFKTADHVIVATDEQADYARECGIPSEKISVVKEFIDRSLPMFSDYVVDDESLDLVEADIEAGKTCIYLPFRLSDEGYKIWEIIDSIHTKVMFDEVVVYAPNLNGASCQELVKLCRDSNPTLSEEMILDTLAKFKPISASRDTYYTLIDYCPELVIPYFEDWKFVMHAAVDELILGSKKPSCTVLQSKSELDQHLQQVDNISMAIDKVEHKKDTMDYVFKTLICSRSFKRVVMKQLAKKKLPSFVFSGVGKNWYICEKVVKTFISMGIQAQALDCTHALHGDLGMLRTDDDKVLVFVSRSGTTSELVKMAKVVKALKDKHVLRSLETIALFLNPSKPNPELFDEWIVPDDLSVLSRICEFDERNLVPSLSINILQMVLDLLGVILYEGHPELVDGYVYNHLSGANGEKLGGTAILKDIH